jgi:hypothetical protein
MMSNPFFHGNPASPGQFLDRRKELRRVAGRLVSQGQSSAIVGGPRTGKTSMLEYLAAPETRDSLYGPGTEGLLFAFLDAQTLGAQFDQAQFWKHALEPLYEAVIAPGLDPTLSHAYALCRDNDFGTFVLERLLTQMAQARRRLVLLLDEFDTLLHHPTLKRAEFFGSLRSLASRTRGLALVIASRSPLERLNRDTQELSRTGSPFFNIFAEITLGPWPDTAVEELLDGGRKRFSAGDRRFIKEAAGAHPYLLQVAASALWEAYEDTENDVRQRRQQAAQDLHDEAGRVLGEIWSLWGPGERRAFLAVSLAHLDVLCGPGPAEPDQYSSAAIRNLVRDAFTERELKRFCQDTPLFAALADRFGSGWALEDMIDALLEYCQKRLLVPELLAGVRQLNPRQYQRYEVRLSGAAGDVSSLNAELELLARQGFVVQDGSVRGGWRVRPLTLLSWLAGELRRAVTTPESFRAWLRAQEVDALLAGGEEQCLAQAAQRVASLADGEVGSLIEVSARRE